MMIVLCPHCGKPVVVNGLGRKRLNIPVKIVCDAVQTHGSVTAAARQLRCSRAYIHNALKNVGLKSKDIIAAGKGRNVAVNTTGKGVKT